MTETANVEFNVQFLKAKKNLRVLDNLLYKKRTLFWNDGKKNWDFVDDLASVNEVLDELIAGNTSDSADQTERKMVIVIKDGTTSEIHTTFKPDFEIVSIDLDYEKWASLFEQDYIRDQHELLNGPPFKQIEWQHLYIPEEGETNV